jgi:hypothetical protein
LRVLLDENLPHALRNYLPEHETVTAAYADLAGLKKGELLDAVEHAGFDVLVTGDKTLEFEQNLIGTGFRGFAIDLPLLSVYRLGRIARGSAGYGINTEMPGKRSKSARLNV